MHGILYFLIVLLSCTQGASSKLAGSNGNNIHPVIFNTLKSVPPFLFFFIISIPNFQFHLPTLGYGIAFAVSQCVSMHCGYKALSIGPMSLSSMIASFSLIIPCLYGILFCNEPITVIKAVGFVLLIGALLITNSAKKSTNNQISGRWVFYITATLVCNGIVSVIQKIHQLRYTGNYLNEFMMFATLATSLIFVVCLIYGKHWRTWKKTRRTGLGVLAGLTNSGVHYLTLALAGAENASVLFPVISGGTIAASVLCGRFFFKEKQSSQRIIGFILGIISVILLKL